MMGYMVFRTYTIIRGRVFRRMHRQLIRAGRELASLGYVPCWRAAKLTAYKGWLKYSNSEAYCAKHDLAKLLYKAAQSVSRRGRKEWIEHEQRILCAASTGG